MQAVIRQLYAYRKPLYESAGSLGHVRGQAALHRIARPSQSFHQQPKQLRYSSAHQQPFREKATSSPQVHSFARASHKARIMPSSMVTSLLTICLVLAGKSVSKRTPNCCVCQRALTVSTPIIHTARSHCSIAIHAIS